MNRIFGLGVAILFFLIIDFYFFQAVKTAVKNLSPDVQKWIKILYWAIPIISLVSIVALFAVFPGYVSAKVRNLITATFFIIYFDRRYRLVFQMGRFQVC
jgi:uncharacterized protein